MTADHRAPRLLWLSDQSHVEHPFMRQWIVACHEAGHEVHVVDRTADPIDVPYHHSGTLFHRDGIRIGRHFVRRTAKISRLTGWPVLLVKALWNSPDICVVDLPSTLLAGWLCKIAFHCRLVYHPYELFGEQASRPNWFLARIEQWLLGGQVDCLVTQNDMRANFYRISKGYQGEVVIVNNTKKAPLDHMRRHDLRQVLGVSTGMRLVIYEGALIPGRCLEELVEAFGLIERDDIGLILVGKLTMWAQEKLVPRMKNARIQGKVWHMNHVPHNEVVPLVRSSDAGIIIYDPQYLNNLYCAPGKLSDYLHAGVPVIVPNFPTLGELVRSRQIGVTFDGTNAKSISKAVLEVFSRPREKWAANIARALEDIRYENDLRAFLAALTLDEEGGSDL